MQECKFLLYLLNEFERRKAINSNYSLRSFARHLNISPSLLSRILRGKIIITENMLDRFSAPLGIDPSQYKIFYNDIKTLRKKRNGHIDDTLIGQLSAEEFEYIQEWYHYVILEMISTDGFKPTPDYIAKKLNISKKDASKALARLMDIGQLRSDKNGNLIVVQEYLTTTNNKFITVAHKNRQRQVLLRAIEAIDDIPLELRDQGAITVAGDSDLVDDVKEKVKAFRRSLATYIENNSKKKDQVYEFTTSFFPWMSE